MLVVLSLLSTPSCNTEMATTHIQEAAKPASALFELAFYYSLQKKEIGQTPRQSDCVTGLLNSEDFILGSNFKHIWD